MATVDRAEDFEVSFHLPLTKDGYYLGVDLEKPITDLEFTIRTLADLTPEAREAILEILSGSIETIRKIAQYMTGKPHLRNP